MILCTTHYLPTWTSQVANTTDSDVWDYPDMTTFHLCPVMTFRTTHIRWETQTSPLTLLAPVEFCRIYMIDAP
jgi:hypothetical protein